MTPTFAGIVGFAVLIVLMFLRMPVGFVMALVGYLGFGMIVSWHAASNLIVRDFYYVFSSYNLTVIPLFVLMGQIAFHAGISGRLFHAAHKFFGHLPGGMAVATIGACAGFSAVCGSTSATAATMASVALPEMKKFNYSPALATGVVAAGGSLGILIPPSTIFIIYGIMTEQSIGELFLAGVIPGILLSCFFVLSIFIWTFFRPEIGPRGPKTTWKEKLKSLSGLIETLLLFVIVMGGLFAGLFTPTEAASIGASGTIVIALVGRHLTWQGFKNALYDTTRITCMIFVVVAGATVFGHFLAVTRIPSDIGAFVSTLDLHPMIVMGVIIVIYLLLGCLMDSLAMIMLTIPIFYPVILSMGFDPVWFGVVIVVVTGMGVITPPIGINAYVVAGVARDVPLHVIFKGTLHMLYSMIALAALLLIFPQIALFLPQLIR